MSYFSRLTDIVTCNLTEILAREADPQAALAEILREMEEGLSGARRSVATAAASEERIRRELDEHRAQIASWSDRARQAVSDGDEARARAALMRKHEVEDVVAGLQQEHKAAAATREHLSTMLRALDARLAEARRKLQELQTGAVEEPAAAAPVGVRSGPATSFDADRAREVDEELEALRRELGRSGS